MNESFVDILVFCVASTCHYHWLLYVLVFNEFSYFFTCCISIHNWHWAIHEYYPVGKFTFFISGNNKIKSFLSRMSSINNLMNIRIAWLLEYNWKPENIIGLIVYNHNPSIFIHLYNNFIFLSYFLEIGIII